MTSPASMQVAVLRRRCSRRPGGGSARRASLFGSLSVSPVSGSLMRDARAEIRGARLDDDLAREAGDLVELLDHRDAFDDVAELHDAADLGEDRHSRTRPTRRGAGPALTFSPSATLRTAPYTRRWCSRSRPVSSTTTSSPWRFMTTDGAVATSWRGSRCGCGRCPRCAPRASSARSCRAPPRHRCGTCAS